jgi:D-serine deaminase-like pyridoxal phosphate-dependent protein
MPTLLLDKRKCLGNIERMARKAQDHGLSLRPHFKTHQSAEIGSWFRDLGLTGITVSSFRMAAYFARAGWEEILVAFPFNPHDLYGLNQLSGSARISILLDNPDTLQFLKELRHPAGFYIDIDTGYGRTGIKSEDTAAIEQLLAAASANGKLGFKGFYCHAGHSYKAGSQKERDAIHRKALLDLQRLKHIFSRYGPRVLYGDTPNCSTQEDFTGIDEITPGNFVFYDLFQHSIGSCTLEEIAVAVACPVTGKYPDSRRILVHGGAVHFSKESLRLGNREVYGRVVIPAGKGSPGIPAEKGWPVVPAEKDHPGTPGEEGWTVPAGETCLTGISQEHGILENTGKLFDRVSIGDTLCFLPVHSCLTAHLMGEYTTLDGELISTLNSK